ncbi:hypothetical protein E2C01_001464 [Portunus trituberculatus]|uniref:Uncharacterized protein n=1 Tax=Portunus trituberculatus TaxID=210409 RepID=A0A5B7CHC6_PORTR|nr:hypothetical protein [Portunus trituberculatus]
MMAWRGAGGVQGSWWEGKRSRGAIHHRPIERASRYSSGSRVTSAGQASPKPLWVPASDKGPDALACGRLVARPDENNDLDEVTEKGGRGGTGGKPGHEISIMGEGEDKVTLEGRGGEEQKGEAGVKG